MLLSFVPLTLGSLVYHLPSCLIDAKRYILFFPTFDCIFWCDDIAPDFAISHTSSTSLEKFATIHAATGTEVAVKVRHPGVVRSIQRDFALMLQAAKLATVIPAIRKMRPEETLAQFAAPLQEQVPTWPRLALSLRPHQVAWPGSH